MVVRDQFIEQKINDSQSTHGRGISREKEPFVDVEMHKILSEFQFERKIQQFSSRT